MPTRHRVHVAEAQFQWTPSTTKYDRQIADWIDSIAATGRQNHAEKADATIIREFLLSSHLQHKKSGTDHHRGSGTKAV